MSPYYYIFIPVHMIVAYYYGIRLAVCPSVRPSIFSFPDDNLCKCQWTSTKLNVCIDIVEIWFGIVNGQILSIFDSYLPTIRLFSFSDDNFSKYQWIFTKLGACIDIMETWFGIADGQISSVFDSHLPETCPYFHFWTITLVNIDGFSPNLVCALILWRSALGLLMGKFYLFLTELSASNTSIFYFEDNNLSKSQWIFSKFDMCIYIVEIRFGIAHCQISSIFDRVICPGHDNGRVLLFHILLDPATHLWLGIMVSCWTSVCLSICPYFVSGW